MIKLTYIYFPNVAHLSKSSSQPLPVGSLTGPLPLLDFTLPFPNSVDTDCFSLAVILTLTFYCLILGARYVLCMWVVYGEDIFSLKIEPCLSLPLSHTELSTMWALKE